MYRMAQKSVNLKHSLVLTIIFRYDPLGIALSIGPNWVGFTWGRRENPISETLYFVNILDKDKTMDNIQEYNR
jgi:hypothetical protein